MYNSLQNGFILAVGGNRCYGGESRCSNRNGIKCHHCPRLKGRLTFCQISPSHLRPGGPFSLAFAFGSSSCFRSSFCFCSSASSPSSVSLACFLGRFLRGRTWRLPPLPQTLPPEAELPRPTPSLTRPGGPADWLLVRKLPSPCRKRRSGGGR